MKPGQFVFYITHHIGGYNNIASCNLPGVRYFLIKNSPYRLILAKKQQ